MCTKVGVWIDHEKACIVSLVKDNVNVMHFDSNIPEYVHLSRRGRLSSPYASQNFSPEKRIEEKYRNQTHKFYKKIIHQLDDADHIFLFGPGEARLELKKEMKKSKERFTRIRGVERSDKMTENQMIAAVKKFFAMK